MLEISDSAVRKQQKPDKLLITQTFTPISGEPTKQAGGLE
jgi:hypothetical protein